MSSKEMDLRSVSELISKDLQLSLFDKWRTGLSKTKTKIEDKIESLKVCNMGIEEMHQAGSIAEGTAVETSDSDRMIQLSGIEILESRDTCVNVKEGIIYFVSDSSKCNPGYVRLLPSEHNKSMYHTKLKTHFCDDRQPMSDEFYLSSDWFRYMSSEWFRYMMVSLTQNDDEFPFEIVQHGPCTMTYYEYFYQDMYSKRVTKHDTAYALTYRGWPEEAIEWKTRDRNFGWPAPTLISKISKMNCHVVPVGDSSSTTCSLEWRQSFLLCEKELIWNFNDTQIQCYVIMKRLVKKYIDPLAPDQISSYNLKTVIFWVSEEHGLYAWTPAKLLLCLKDCLAHLSQCIKRRNLPHYFVRKANLFTHRFLSLHEKKVAIEKLRNVTDNIVISTLNAGLHQQSRLCKLWNDSGKKLPMFLSEGVKNEFLENYRVSLLLRRKTVLHSAEFEIIKRYTSNITSDQVISKTLQFLNKKHHDVDEAVAARVMHYMHIRRGVEHLQKATQSNDKGEKRNLQEIALSEIEKGSKLDMLSGPLYLATYYMSIKDIPKCIAVIEECIANLPSKMFYAGYCSSNKFMEIKNGKPFKKTGFDIPPNEINALETTFDMLFAKEDYKVVPASVVISCACALLPQYGEKYVAIHPFVYAYHLLHFAKVLWEGQSWQTKEILDYLEDLVTEFCDTPHVFNSLNIIGYSQFLEENNVEAFVQFAVSLQSTSTVPNVKNGAAWWMAIILHAVQSTFNGDL